MTYLALTLLAQFALFGGLFFFGLVIESAWRRSERVPLVALLAYVFAWLGALQGATAIARVAPS